MTALTCTSSGWVKILVLLVLSGVFTGCTPSSDSSSQCGTVNLLNVSYDPTRELYKDVNAAFAEHWKQQTGRAVRIRMSHGGAGKQARAVIDGLEADVVTLALAYDIDAMHRIAGLVPADWQSRLPCNSCPYTSTIIFLVRKGNPKGINDWNDLIKPDVEVITPHPKTSGGARWNYLAAWGYILKRELGSFEKLTDPAAAEEAARAQEKAKAFVRQLYQHVPVLDSGARGSTMTFTKGIGDVLLAWENEAFLSLKKDGADQFEIVVPSISIRAEPPVTVIDKVAQKHGTQKIAEAYLQFLYCPQGQKFAAKHFYRPRKTEGIPEELLHHFAKVDLFTIEEVFGGWQKAQQEHFGEGGVFDQIYQPK